MGRILLASRPREQAIALIEKSDLTPRTSFSVTDPAEILGCVDQAREDGLAIFDQEVEAGLHSIAVPLIGKRGRTVAALNTGMAATAAGVDTLADTFLPKRLHVQAGLRRVL
nr:IclR family transcriptional regulator C-terminal domain-containing protein [Marinicella sp. W31]MDC2875589.1 IclR family transcriptional regulator C-terminal domain-containing protein [Marinicella sp. W31]